MAFQQVPDCARFVMKFDWSGQKCVNVYHAFVETGWTPTLLEDVGDALIAWWDAELKEEVTSTVTLELVTAQELNAETDPIMEISTGLPLQATSAAASAPNNCTFAVQWRTNQTGRSYRGRTFHIGLTTTKYATNMLTVPNQSAFVGQYGALIGVVQTAGASLVVVSRYSNGTQRPSGIHTVIQSCRIDRVLDSMRRRLPDRGA